MSSSQELAASGPALQGQPVEGMLKDLWAMTSSKRRESRNDSSPDCDNRDNRGKGFWATDVEPMTDDGSSDDDFKTATAKVGKEKKKKKKKLKAQVSLEELKKAGYSKMPKASEIPIKSIKGPWSGACKLHYCPR